jgi:2-keto-4-pentenoate hydratase/2-oxohepta-3-ene-1,7-dioic acid hydratase in catechol pathway
MRIVRYETAGATGYGSVEGGRIRPLAGPLHGLEPSGEPHIALSEVRLLAPCAPTKIVAIGPNFGAYFPDSAPPEAPMLWVKPQTCLNHPDGAIELPAGHTINHEVELALVIGRTARDVAPAEAPAHILGYTCMIDVTAGDFETPGAFPASHYFVDGKIFDGFAPLGPAIVTDLDVSDLRMECRVNGETRQSHSTSDFLFSPAFVLSLVSSIMTLLPGDVISLGSPPGVRPIRHGDRVEVEIEGIGVLACTARDRTRAAAAA